METERTSHYIVFYREGIERDARIVASDVCHDVGWLSEIDPYWEISYPEPKWRGLFLFYFETVDTRIQSSYYRSLTGDESMRLHRGESLFGPGVL